MREQIHLLPNFKKSRRGEGIRAAIGHGLHHQHHAVGVPIRQAVKNHRIDHAEHRSVRPYAQCQSHDSHSRETWVVVQHAKSVADVLQQAIHFHHSHLTATIYYPLLPYSYRNASTGSIRVAFCAGNQTASKATAIRRSGTTTKETGSHILT